MQNLHQLFLLDPNITPILRCNWQAALHSALFNILHLGCGVAQSGCGMAQLGCGLAQLGCSMAQLGCGVAQLGCGMAQLGCGVGTIRVRIGSIRERRGSISVRRGSNGSLSACCEAGPSLIPGLAPHGGLSDEDTRRQGSANDERMKECVIVLYD
jgi:hypothetical protein